MNKIRSIKDYKKRYIKNRIEILLFQIFIIVLFFSFWEILVNLNILNEFLISKPSKIFSLTMSYIKSSSLNKHILSSTIETLGGLFIGTGGGISIAIILYIFPRLNKIMDPFLTMLNALPKTALGPLLIILLGTSMKGIIGICVSLNIIITIITSLQYFKNVDASLIKMFTAFHASKYQLLTKLILPSNIDNILSLIKVNIGLSWVGTIVGEFLISKQGIGYLLVYGGQVFRLDIVVMGIIILSLIALLMYEMINIIQIIYRKKFKIKNNNI